MKIKDTINFKALRDKGPSSLELAEEEVIQLTTKKEMLCIIRQDFLQELLEAKNELEKITASFSITNTKLQGFANNSSLNARFQSNAPVYGAVSNIVSEPTLEQRVAQLEKEVLILKKGK